MLILTTALITILATLPRVKRRNMQRRASSHLGYVLTCRGVML